MEVKVYVCDRCEKEFNVEKTLAPATVTMADYRFRNEAPEIHQLCDDCWYTVLCAMNPKEKARKLFDEVAAKISGELKEETE